MKLGDGALNALISFSQREHNPVSHSWTSNPHEAYQRRWSQFPFNIKRTVTTYK